MSETEHKRGKLFPVTLHGGLENTARLLLEASGIKPSKYCDTFLEQLEDEMYRKYFINGGVIYRIDADDIEQYEDIYTASRNDDGSINFEVKFYNGGGSLNEALEDAIDNIVDGE